MGLEISERYSTPPTVFIQCQANFMMTLVTVVEYRLLLFLAIGRVLWHFEILTWEANGKT